MCGWDERVCVCLKLNCVDGVGRAGMYRTVIVGGLVGTSVGLVRYLGDWMRRNESGK